MHEDENEEKANEYVTPCDGNQNESQTQSAGTDSDDDDELDTDYIIKHIDIEDDIQKPTASPDEQGTFLVTMKSKSRRMRVKYPFSNTNRHDAHNRCKILPQITK